MSLLFGALTNDFVNFGIIAQDVNFNLSDSRLAAAAETFRTDAAKDASDLVYIGIAMFAATYIYMYVWVHTGESCACARARVRASRVVCRRGHGEAHT